ncbi:MAG: DoxX family membrane protein [Phycisphaerae bacterium]|nr:DoxX family membrane protein [Phycisphaerae bacterium]
MKPNCNADSNPGSNPVRDGLLFVSRMALAAVFALAAYHKLFGEVGASGRFTGPQDFARAVDAFEVLPKSLVPAATFVVPWVEAVCAVMLVVGFWTRAAAGVLALALVGFIGLVISAIVRKMSLTCGCFGAVQLFCPKELGWCNVVQNTALLAPAVFVLAKGHGRLGIDGACGRGSGACESARGAGVVDGGGAST